MSLKSLNSVVITLLVLTTALTLHSASYAGFTDIEAGLPGVDNCSLAWGDYDNDGDLDLAITGSLSNPDDHELICRIYRNDNGTFTDIEAGLTGAIGYLAWGDYDGDGDLDLLMAGHSGTSDITRIYRNDETNVNTAPNAPTGLNSSITGNSITFSWSAASDAQTPASGLCYNLRVGTAPGKDDVFSGMANALTGLRRLPAIGNAQKRLSWTLKDLPAGTLYWSVQAIDTAYASSAWAVEQQVIIPDTTAPVINSVAVTPSMAAAGNTATDTSASYKTAQVVGSSIAGAALPVMSAAKDNFLFRFWGKVEIIDSTSFWLDDGSPFRIKIIAPGYAGITDDDYITARGILDPADPPVLTCPAGTVLKLK